MNPYPDVPTLLLVNGVSKHCRQLHASVEREECNVIVDKVLRPVAARYRDRLARHLDEPGVSESVSDDLNRIAWAFYGYILEKKKISVWRSPWKKCGLPEDFSVPGDWSTEKEESLVRCLKGRVHYLIRQVLKNPNLESNMMEWIRSSLQKEELRVTDPQYPKYSRLWPPAGDSWPEADERLVIPVDRYSFPVHGKRRGLAAKAREHDVHNLPTPGQIGEVIKKVFSIEQLKYFFSQYHTFLYEGFQVHQELASVASIDETKIDDTDRSDDWLAAMDPELSGSLSAFAEGVLETVSKLDNGSDPWDAKSKYGQTFLCFGLWMGLKIKKGKRFGLEQYHEESGIPVSTINDRVSRITSALYDYFCGKRPLNDEVRPEPADYQPTLNLLRKRFSAYCPESLRESSFNKDNL